MLEVYRALERAARARHGGLGATWLFVRALCDLVSSAVRSNGTVELADGAGRRFTREGTGMVPTTFRHDLEIAARSLVKSPGFTAVAVLTLALGIGANTAIWSVVYGVLLRPLGLPDERSLVVVDLHREAPSADLEGFWPAYYRDFDARISGDPRLQGITSFVYESATLQSGEEPIELGQALLVEDDFFDVLGAPPLAGRLLQRGDALFGRRGTVAVLGEEVWRSRFGADPDLVGRTVMLDEQPVTVVGIAPRGLPLPLPGIDVWIPYGWDPEDRSLTGRLAVIARLAPSAAAADVEQWLGGLASELAAAHPRFAGYTISLRGLRESLVGDVRPAVLAAAAGVGLILLISCANMANLLLARATTRAREMATRRAVGAGRAQLAGQLMLESLLVALLGCVAGVSLAVVLQRLLLGMASGTLPRLSEVRLDLPVLGFSLAASILTGVLFGLAPIWQALRVDLASAMRPGIGARRSGRGLGSLQRALLVAQVGFAVTLLVGASLMVRTFLELRRVDPGFNIDGVAGARIYLDEDAYSTDEEAAQYFAALIERLRAEPDIEAAGATTAMPVDPTTVDFDLPYRLPDVAVRDDDLPQAWFRVVSPGYLETMGMTLLRGRDVAESDRVGAETVALVNETFARTAWPGEDALGKSFLIPHSGWHELRVVGVVADVRFRGLDDEVRPEFFVPYRQITYGLMTVVARSADPDAAARAISRLALEIDRRQPVHSVFRVDQLVRASIATDRFLAMLLLAFGGVALLLAAAGIYGVVSYWVNASRAELGVRLALGAGRGSIVGLVLGRSLVTAGLGLVLGLVGGAYAVRAIEGFLYGVRPGDPATIALVVGVLAAAALAASLRPALRAARTDPMRTLRLE